MKILGWVLLAAGMLMLVFRVVNFKTKEKVVDIGPVEINRTEDHSLRWPAYMGGIVAISGAIIIAAGSKRK